MSAFIEEKPNTKYGHWVVIGFDKIDSHGDARWFCECTSCGQVYSVKGYKLRTNRTRQCRKCWWHRR